MNDALQILDALIGLPPTDAVAATADEGEADGEDWETIWTQLLHMFAAETEGEESGEPEGESGAMAALLASLLPAEEAKTPLPDSAADGEVKAPLADAAETGEAENPFSATVQPQQKMEMVAHDVVWDVRAQGGEDAVSEFAPGRGQWLSGEPGDGQVAVSEVPRDAAASRRIMHLLMQSQTRADDSPAEQSASLEKDSMENAARLFQSAAQTKLATASGEDVAAGKNYRRVTGEELQAILDGQAKEARKQPSLAAIRPGERLDAVDVRAKHAADSAEPGEDPTDDGRITSRLRAASGQSKSEGESTASEHGRRVVKTGTEAEKGAADAAGRFAEPGRGGEDLPSMTRPLRGDFDPASVSRMRETEFEPSERTSVRIQVRDSEGSSVTIRLRTDSENLSGRLLVQNPQLLRDLSDNMGELRSTLQDMGYDSVDLNFGSDIGDSEDAWEEQPSWDDAGDVEPEAQEVAPGMHSREARGAASDALDMLV